MGIISDTLFPISWNYTPVNTGNTVDIPGNVSFVPTEFGEKTDRIISKFMGEVAAGAGAFVGGGLSSVLKPLMPMLIILVVFAVGSFVIARRVTGN